MAETKTLADCCVLGLAAGAVANWPTDRCGRRLADATI